MTRITLPRALILLVALAMAPGCKHIIKMPGGDIRLWEDPEPVGPIVDAETHSGVPCGADLPRCRGGTQCFSGNGEAVCMTEEAACKAVGCCGGLCEIIESLPLQAVCH